MELEKNDINKLSYITGKDSQTWKTNFGYQRGTRKRDTLGV